MKKHILGILFVLTVCLTGCNDCQRRHICIGLKGHLMQESLDKIKAFVKEE